MNQSKNQVSTQKSVTNSQFSPRRRFVWMIGLALLVLSVVILFQFPLVKKRTQSVFCTRGLLAISYNRLLSRYPTPPAAPPFNITLFKKQFNQPKRPAAFEAIPLRDSAVVYEGDEVQIQYRTPYPYGAIFSVDGRKVVSLHSPNRPQESVSLPAGTHVLPFGFELDDAPGFEIFFFVTAPTPFSLNKYLKQAARIHNAADSISPLDSHVQIFKLVLHKRTANHSKIGQTE